MINTRTTTKTNHYFRALMALAVLAVLASLLVVLAASPTHASLFYTVNDTGDEADANPGDGLCDVQPSAPVLRCTLRAAIQESNANPTSPENIFFNIAGDGVHTISPASGLPTITSGKTTIKGKLNSIADQAYSIEFYSNPAGTDEGKKFVGQKSVTTDGSGNATFTFTPSSKVGQTITATKNTTGDTSEFSDARKVASS